MGEFSTLISTDQIALLVMRSLILTMLAMPKMLFQDDTDMTLTGIV
jgi:hypothetical protein